MSECSEWINAPERDMRIFALIVCVFRQTEDGLTEDECAAVSPLVFATHRGLACAAGGFLYHTYVQLHHHIIIIISPHTVMCCDPVCRLCCVLDGRADKRSVSFLCLLAHFFMKSQVNHPHPIMHLLLGSSLFPLTDHLIRVLLQGL